MKPRTTIVLAASHLAVAAIGGPTTVASHLTELARVTQADEFMVVSDVFDPLLRLRSLDIVAQAMRSASPVSSDAMTMGA